MIAVQQHGPARRTYEEDEEEEFAAKFVTPSDRVKTIMREGAAFPHNVGLLLVVTSLHASVLATTLVKMPGLVQIGELVLSRRKEPLAILHHDETNNSTVVMLKDIPDDVSFVVADILGALCPLETIVMGDMSFASYEGRVEEGGLLYLTPAASSQAIVAGSARLDCGQVISGVAAAILSYAGVRGWSATLYLTLSRPFLTEPAMRAFERILPTLEKLTGWSVALPSAADYARAIRHDPYLLRTENMYS